MNEKYSYGHVCKKKQFNLIIIEEEEGNEGDGATNKANEENQYEISVNALMGNKSTAALKITGNVGRKKLNILIDSGNTNNFIDAQTTNKLNYTIEETIPWIITVADGGKTTNKCSQFRWNMQGIPFIADLRLLKLGGCDLILGVDWMWEHILKLLISRNMRYPSKREVKE